MKQFLLICGFSFQWHLAAWVKCIKNRTIGFIPLLESFLDLKERKGNRVEDCKSVIDTMDCGSGREKERRKFTDRGGSGEINSFGKSPEIRELAD